MLWMANNASSAVDISPWCACCRDGVSCLVVALAVDAVCRISVRETTAEHEVMGADLLLRVDA